MPKGQKSLDALRKSIAAGRTVLMNGQAIRDPLDLPTRYSIAATDPALADATIKDIDAEMAELEKAKAALVESKNSATPPTAPAEPAEADTKKEDAKK